MKDQLIADLEDIIDIMDFDSEYQEFLALSGPISMNVEDLEYSLKNIMQFYDQNMAQQTSLPPSTENSES